MEFIYMYEKNPSWKIYRNLQSKLRGNLFERGLRENMMQLKSTTESL